MNDSVLTPPLGAAHGSHDGYDGGCRTARMCPHDGSSEWLTCAEAAVRRRGDYGWMSFPRFLAMPRDDSPESAKRALAAAPQRSLVHGTIWGYARGCRDSRRCPRGGGRSCFEARRAYLQQWRLARLANLENPLEHGTTRGYTSGCRAQSTCPGDATGRTCIQAQRAYKLTRARNQGVRERRAADNAESAAAHVRALLACGVSIRELARRSGVGRTTLSELARYGAAGARSVFSPTTTERVLLVAHPALSVS